MYHLSMYHVQFTMYNLQCTIYNVQFSFEHFFIYQLTYCLTAPANCTLFAEAHQAEASVHGKWYMRLFYIIIMPHHITDALCQEVWHDSEAYEAKYMRHGIAKRVCVEYA